MLCLVRLGDTAGATLSKLRKTMVWCNEKFKAVNEMTQVGDDELASKMSQCWIDHMEEFQSPITDAVYVIDLQWINEARIAGAAVMENSWKIAKEILCKGQTGLQQHTCEGVGGIKNMVMTRLQASFIGQGYSLGVLVTAITTMRNVCASGQNMIIARWD